MTTTCTKNPDSTVTLTVTVDGDRWKKAQKKAFNKRKQSLNLKGFRKGNVPDAMAKKYIPEDAVFYYAVDELAPQILEEGVRENKLDVVDRPSMDYRDASKDSVVIEFTIPVLEEPVLGEYKNLGLAKETAEVTDADVDAAVKSLQRREAVMDEENVTDETEAAEGDEVTIDFKGTIDGEAFDGGSAEDQDLVIGSNSFIPGFESQLVGLKKGEEKDITVTFPADYPASNLAGKEAVFHVTVKNLKKEILPELTDEFAASLGIDGVTTVDELKEHEKNVLTERTNAEADRKWTDELVASVVNNAEVTVPEAIINAELQNIMTMFSNNLRQNGISFDEYVKLLGGNTAVVEEQFRPQALERAKTKLVLEAVAKKENLTVTPEDINQEIEALANAYQMDVKSLASRIDVRALVDDMLVNKTVQFLKSVNE